VWRATTGPPQGHSSDGPVMRDRPGSWWRGAAAPRTMFAPPCLSRPGNGAIISLTGRRALPAHQTMHATTQSRVLQPRKVSNARYYMHDTIDMALFFATGDINRHVVGEA
jgi:hypothetical protein